MGLTNQSQCGPATRCSPEGQRVSDSRDWDDSPSVLDGDPWPGLSGELSPGSEEAPVMPGEPPNMCPVSSFGCEGEGTEARLLHNPEGPRQGSLQTPGDSRD